MKTAFTAAVAIIAIAAALLGDSLHSQAHADSPTSAATRASQSPGDASQALRRYALQLLHILSAPDANQWERYRQAMPHCEVAPTYLDEIGSGNDASPLDATLVALTEDLCADLDQRLDEARTVGLLVNEPEAMRGYTLITGNFNNDVHLIDHLGRVAHSWDFENLVSHARLLDNGNLLAELVYLGRGGILEVDPDSNIVWQYTYPDKFHHDFLKMPNGNVLMLAAGDKTTEEAVAAGANTAIVHLEGMKYDYLIEMRPTGSEGGDIVWEWHAWDYIVQSFDPTKPNYGDPSEHPELIDINFLVETSRINPQNDVWDWLHINAIDYNPELDQILLSPRHYGELWIIDRSATSEDAVARSSANAGNENTPLRTDVLTNKLDGGSGKSGALLYRWGNPRAYRQGTFADQRLFWQHHTQWIDPELSGAGNILVFNNGYDIIENPRRYSSIEEIVPPVDGYGYLREPGTPYPPTNPIWSYTARNPTDFYSSVISGVQRLPNGNTLICAGTSGDVFQVTPDGRTVWRYVYPMDGDTPLKQGDEPSIKSQLLAKRDTFFNNAVYRAYWYEPDHPGLRKYDLTPGDTIELYE